MRTRWTGVAVLCLAVTGSAMAQRPAGVVPSPTGSAPQATFRAATNFVEIDASVVDAKGAPILDLAAGDFEVWEDGQRQEIAAFSTVRALEAPAGRVTTAVDGRGPRAPAGASAAVSDVAENAQSDGRLYLVVLDDLQTDLTRTPRVKAIMRGLIEERLGAGDRMAIVYTSGIGAASQDFTDSRASLLASVDAFVGKKLQSLAAEKLEARQTVREAERLANGLGGNGIGGGDIATSIAASLAKPDLPGAQMVRAIDLRMEQPHVVRAQAAMTALRKSVEFMSVLRGRRKALIFVGEGIDVDLERGDALGGSTAAILRSAMHEAIAIATRNNTIIYTIDPRGFTVGMADGAISAPDPTPPDTFTNPRTGEVMPVPRDSSVMDSGSRDFQNEVRQSRDSLRVLAEETGGFAVLTERQWSTALDRIVAENGNYYLLGYYPRKDRQDGTFRKVQVKTTRPGLKVQARRGYYATASSSMPVMPVAASSPALASAIMSPLPTTGLPLRVFAAAFKGAAPNAAIAMTVEVDASKLDFQERDGTYRDTLELVSTITDSTGKVYPRERQTVNLTLSPATLARAKTDGFRILALPMLPPGRYQLRVAAGNSMGRVGSVIYDLDVPDFWKQPLTLSGIALTSRAAANTPTADIKNPLATLLPTSPTARRTFASTDVLTLFGEVYERDADAPEHDVDIRMQVRTEDGRVVREASEDRSSMELENGAGGLAFTTEFPLAGLAAGRYVLHVEATTPVGDKPTASRDVPFRIE